MRNEFIENVEEELSHLEDKYMNYASDHSFKDTIENARLRGHLTDEDESIESKLNNIKYLKWRYNDLKSNMLLWLNKDKYTYDELLMHYILDKLNKSESKKLKNSIWEDKKVREKAISLYAKAVKEQLISEILGGKSKVESYHTRKQAKEIEKKNNDVRELNGYIYRNVIEIIESEFDNYCYSFLYDTYYKKDDKDIKNDSYYYNSFETYSEGHDSKYYPKDIVDKCQFILLNNDVNKTLAHKISQYRDLSVEFAKTKYLLKLMMNDLHISDKFIKTREACKKIIYTLSNESRRIEKKIENLHININELYKKYSEKQDVKSVSSKFVSTSKEKEQKDGTIMMTLEETQRRNEVEKYNANWKYKAIKEKTKKLFYEKYGRYPGYDDEEKVEYKLIRKEAESGVDTQLKNVCEQFADYMCSSLESDVKKQIMNVTGEDKITNQQLQTLIADAILTPEERYIRDMVEAGKMKEGVKTSELSDKDYKNIKKHSNRYADGKCDVIIKKYLNRVEEVKKTNYFSLYSIPVLQKMVNEITFGNNLGLYFQNEEIRKSNSLHR